MEGTMRNITSSSSVSFSEAERQGGDADLQTRHPSSVELSSIHVVPP
jgi:hypothetical protein